MQEDNFMPVMTCNEALTFQAAMILPQQHHHRQNGKGSFLQQQQQQRYHASQLDKKLLPSKGRQPAASCDKQLPVPHQILSRLGHTEQRVKEVLELVGLAQHGETLVGLLGGGRDLLSVLTIM
jgi:flagellar motor switch/type III secretory pathway protein FliN